MLKQNGSRRRGAPLIMTTNRKKPVIIILLLFVTTAIAFFFFKTSFTEKSRNASYQVLYPERINLRESITCIGIVEPRNRLEIHPTISGRIDTIMVKEGQKVKTGEILVWMSSEERAALIDAARAKGSSSIEYWARAYKPIPILAPISGTIIVRDIEPGQSVTSTATILVISDRLIVRAIVDETDIGKVMKNQKSVISLDAYPDVSVPGVVNHISYESTTVNNVTTYEVDIIPDTVPAVFRSGMTANVDIIQAEKKDALSIPVSAVQKKAGRSEIQVFRGNSKKPVSLAIETGISNGSMIEVVSGIDEKTRIAVSGGTFELPAGEETVNPFMPRRKSRKEK